MFYITGKHALNIGCSLETCGDWHRSALQWSRPFIRNSAESIYGDYGIEPDKAIPDHNERYSVANHIRAILDLLELNMISLAQGMNKDFISNSSYTNEIFDLVMKLNDKPHWNEIDRFMGKEYYSEWLNYKRAMNDD